MDDLKIEIEKVENGFILTWDEPTCSEDEFKERVKKCKEVIEIGDEENEAWTKLLERIADFFGKSYDRYSSTNLDISWGKKGHKVE